MRAIFTKPDLEHRVAEGDEWGIMLDELAKSINPEYMVVSIIGYFPKKEKAVDENVENLAINTGKIPTILKMYGAYGDLEKNKAHEIAKAKGLYADLMGIPFDTIKPITKEMVTEDIKKITKPAFVGAAFSKTYSITVI
jgi:hypothetical protein